MKITLGFSPCPNDTFIFDALVNHKIDTGELQFEPVLEDVQTLNEWALAGKLDVTKLSFPAFFSSTDHYRLLHAGSALGNGVGPLLITKTRNPEEPPSANARIALPGINTTANLLFTFAYPDAGNKEFMIFSDIEEAVVNGKADYGVIIHENRFTYQEKGLLKVADLGNVWEEKMQAPIPLGGIAVHKRMEGSLAKRVDALTRKSLEFAFSNYPALPSYVREHSQAMNEEVMRQHIDLYVNTFSLDLGEEGRKAILALYSTFARMNGINELAKPGQLFL